MIHAFCCRPELLRQPRFAAFFTRCAHTHPARLLAPHHRTYRRYGERIIHPLTIDDASARLIGTEQDEIGPMVEHWLKEGFPVGLGLELVQSLHMRINPKPRSHILQIARTFLKALLPHCTVDHQSALTKTALAVQRLLESFEIKQQIMARYNQLTAAAAAAAAPQRASGSDVGHSLPSATAHLAAHSVNQNIKSKDNKFDAHNHMDDGEDDDSASVDPIGSVDDKEEQDGDDDDSADEDPIVSADDEEEGDDCDASHDIKDSGDEEDSENSYDRAGIARDSSVAEEQAAADAAEDAEKEAERREVRQRRQSQLNDQIDEAVAQRVAQLVAPRDEKIAELEAQIAAMSPHDDRIAALEVSAAELNPNTLHPMNETIADLRLRVQAQQEQLQAQQTQMQALLAQYQVRPAALHDSSSQLAPVSAPSLARASASHTPTTASDTHSDAQQAMSNSATSVPPVKTVQKHRRAEQPEQPERPEQPEQTKQTKQTTETRETRAHTTHFDHGACSSPVAVPASASVTARGSAPFASVNVLLAPAPAVVAPVYASVPGVSVQASSAVDASVAAPIPDSLCY